MVSKSYRLCRQSGKKIHICLRQHAGHQVLMKLRSKTKLSASTLFFMPTFFLLEPEEILAQKEKAAGSPPPP
jgi:hypothetical protein